MPPTRLVLILLVTACSRHPAASGTALLSWQAPTRNLDGSPIRGLAGYTVYYGREPQALLQAVRLEDPGLTQYVIHGLQPGKYYFSVAAFTATGQQSGLAPVVAKVIEGATANQTAAVRSQTGPSAGAP